MPAHVKFGGVMGGGAPVYATKPKYAATLTTTSSAQTAFSADAGDFATVTAVGAAVMVAIGPNPTALANGAGMHRIEAGAVMDFGPLQQGDKLAAIDAA